MFLPSILRSVLSGPEDCKSLLSCLLCPWLDPLTTERSGLLMVIEDDVSH